MAKVNIIINDQPFEVDDSGRVSRHFVVELIKGNDESLKDAESFNVRYDDGDPQSEQRILEDGETAELTEGMRFFVASQDEQERT